MHIAVRAFPGCEREVEVAFAEAWSWLNNQSLIVPAPDINDVGAPKRSSVYDPNWPSMD
jgi:hypothetical protein